MELEKMELRKLDKIVLGCIFGSVPAALFIFYIYSSIAGPSTRQLIIERELSENVNGIVDTVYDDERNHDIRTAILRNHQTYEIERQ